MKYIKYKRLISFFAKLMAFIKRNRIIILSALLGVTAVTSALLVSNGSIVSDSGLPLEIVYGQEISFEANAFMSDVHYQYFDYNLNCWVEGFPKDPGQYTIRAYSKTMFNKTRYGKEHTVTILPKQIIFIVEEDQIRYGDMPTAILKEGSVLAYSDSFTCDGFEFFDLDKEQGKKPLYTDAIESMALIYQIKGQYDEAIKCYDKILVVLEEYFGFTEGEPVDVIIEKKNYLLSKKW